MQSTSSLKNGNKAVLLLGFLSIGGFLMWRSSRIRRAERSTSVNSGSDAELALIQRELYSNLSATSSAAIQDRSRRKIPCCLLCGPLGSGKTTLLRHILREISSHADFTCGAIVNDFADLGVDVEVISQDKAASRPADEPQLVYGVSEGCCCCLREDPRDSDGLEELLQSLRRRVDVDSVVVETSGLSEAAGARARLAELTRLDAVIGVLDANAFPPQSWTSEQDVKSFAMACDVILLNKADVCTTSELEFVKSELLAHGARDVRLTTHARVPLDVIFRVQRHQAEKAELGTSLEERKASLRYQLELTDALYTTALQSLGGGSHLKDVRWTVSELRSRPVESLAFVQDLVCSWSELTLERAKGKIWLKHFPVVFEFQYSGRCRLQMSKMNRALGAKTTRIALVSHNVRKDVAMVEDILFREADDLSISRVHALRTRLSADTRLTLLPFDDGQVIRFSITCEKKFGFSPEVLLIQFGVDVLDVNREFHSRCNSAAGPLLVAFDGMDCFIAPGLLLDVKRALQVMDQELDATIAAKFTVVKNYCRCEA